MSLIRLSSLLVLLSSFGGVAQANSDVFSGFEITPLVGYRFGGDFETSQDGASINPPINIKLSEDVSYGLLLAWDVDSKRQGEFLINHNKSQFSQEVDSLFNNNNLSVTYVHIGGNVPISDGYVPFYVTGGLGLTHLAPEDSMLDDETRFSMSVGLTAKVAVSENLSFRFGGRAYATFFNSDSTIFCNSDVCAISITSDLWIQSEVNAGITFTF